MNKLLSSLNIGAIDLEHRIVLQIPDVVSDHHFDAWASAGGLIYSPAFDIALQGSDLPPISNADDAVQRTRWEHLAERVHARGGLIVAPLRHWGRLPQATMATKAPRQLDQAGIDAVLSEYARAAAWAFSAGFDGVELLADQPHLPYQFLQNRINTRLDSYGGSIANRLCFLLEAVQQLADAFGMHRVGVRLAPDADAAMPQDSDPVGLYRRVLQELFDIDLAYAHLRMQPSDNRAEHEAANELASRLAPYRAAFPAPLLLSAPRTLSLAAELVHRRSVDAAVFEPTDSSAEPLSWMRDEALIERPDADD